MARNEPHDLLLRTRLTVPALALGLLGLGACDSSGGGPPDEQLSQLQAALTETRDEVKLLRAELVQEREAKAAARDLKDTEREARRKRLDERLSERRSPRSPRSLANGPVAATGPATALPLPASAPTRSGPAKAAPSPSDEAASKALATLVDTIECEVGRCKVPRDSLNALLQSPDTFMRQARVVPAMRDGQSEGFKLYGIRSRSLLKALGLSNGDMITSVGGMSLTSPDQALEAYSKLRDAKTLPIELVRRGQRHTLVLEFI